VFKEGKRGRAVIDVIFKRKRRQVSQTCISFSVFCVEVLIIRYDKMVSHMMPTCAFVFVIKACDPGKDLPYHLSDMCTL
jgi:hypothetical protein